MGRIVFFDRNELKSENGEVLCQLRLEEEIVTKRGDRFIIRRPSPQETIGGGWVIDPRGNKYRFGQKTIVELEKKKAGTPEERIETALLEAKGLTLTELVKRTALEEQELLGNLQNKKFIMFNSKEYTLASLVDSIEEEIIDRLETFHRNYPMRPGINKAELLQEMQKQLPKSLVEFMIENGLHKRIFKRKEQFVSLQSFQSHVPKSWEKRTDNLLGELKEDGLKVRHFSDYLTNAGIPESLSGDLIRYLEEQKYVVPLDEQYYWHFDNFKEAVDKLRNHTGSEFEVGEAKEAVDLSRKYMIPFLERLDALGVTRRVESKRIWQR
jgi:selenocysteine-specific elongation factor